MEFDFLSPVDNEIIVFKNNLSSLQLGSKVVFHTDTDFPDIDTVKIAIIGVLENRGNVDNGNENLNLDYIRKELYSLFPGNWHAAIADLGDIVQGNSLDDTYFALQKVATRLIRKGIIPILIGGSQDLTYPLYRAYDSLEQMVNLVSIDSTFDFGKQEEQISSKSYLSKIILDEPNNLFNYTNIGYQTYYNSQEEIDLIEKLFFDAYRLGEISNHIELSEPALRDADIVSLDLNSVISNCTGSFSPFSPNGFSGKEICGLSRYAGISDKVSSFGIFNYDNSSASAVIISQIIWYFIEGVNYRSNEYPFGTRDNYLKYIVPLDNDELVFYKSNKTGRWWIEIHFLTGRHNNLNKYTLLSCSHEDYLGACNNEIPERWWKAQRKNLI
jgi:arginase family enzyme